MDNKNSESFSLEKERNSSGRFVKGHSGFKPKGAVSKKKH